MIEINLLPPELKKQQTASKQLSIDTKNLLYLAPLGFCILLALHIYLAILNAALSQRYHSLDNQWKASEIQRKGMQEPKKEYGLERIIWAEKLNLLSAKLPRGVWFNEIQVSTKEFILKGAVVSAEKQEFNLLNKFLSNLKEDNSFFRDFASLELGLMQRKTVGGYDIINFTLNGTLK